MKKWKLIHLALLCLWLSATVRSQAQSQSVDERFVEAMSALDMAPVLSSTGLFIDRVPSLIPLQLFDGAALNDSIRGNRAILLIAHGSIYGADLGTSPLIEPNSLISMLDAYEESDTVRLGAV